MQCIIMSLYNACYDSCGCILCMQKINNVHVCTCVCASVCVCMCASTMFMCVHVCVCMVVSVCVCVCACPFCTNQLQPLYSNPKSDYSCSQLVTDSKSENRTSRTSAIQKKKEQKKCISFHLGMCAYMITSNEDN